MSSDPPAHIPASTAVSASPSKASLAVRESKRTLKRGALTLGKIGTIQTCEEVDGYVSDKGKSLMVSDMKQVESLCCGVLNNLGNVVLASKQSPDNMLSKETLKGT